MSESVSVSVNDLRSALMQAYRVENINDLLLACAEQGNQQGVRVALAAAADTGLTDLEYKTAADYAREEGYTRIAEMIEAHEAGQPDPKGAFEKVADSSCKMSESVSVSVNDLRSALEWAYEVENIDKVLFECAKDGNVEGLRLALAAGADKDARREYQVTPLHDAAVYRNTSFVQALLAAGADKDARNDNQETPLHDAAAAGYALNVQALIAAGADKDARNKYQVTPLHYAAYWGHGSVVRALLKAGADTSLKDNNKKTAADYAREEGYTTIVRMIEAHEAQQLKLKGAFSAISGHAPADGATGPAGAKKVQAPLHRWA